MSATARDGARLSYNGRRFRPTGGGDASASAGLYHQEGELVWAEFFGPSVRAGRLVGTCRPDGTIDAAYCYVSTDGATVAGSCVSTPRTLADGRIALTERWRRLDGSSGVSEIEEYLDD